MRTGRLAVLMVIIVALAASAAGAQNVSWFGLVGTGSNQAEIQARMSLRTTSGSPVGSNDYVVSVPWGEGLRAQVVFAGDGDPGRYQVEWSCLGAPGDRYNKADYFDNAGWVFEIPAFSLSTMIDTPLHLRVKDLRGRSDYIRILFFTVRTGRHAVQANEALFIRVEPSPPPTPPSVMPVAQSTPPIADPEVVNGNFEQLGTAIEGLNNNDAKLVEAQNANNQRDDTQDARLTRLEEWANQVVTSQEPATATFSQTECLQQKYAGQDVWIFALDERSSLGEARYIFWQRTASGWSACQNQLVVRQGDEVFLPNARVSSWPAFGFSGVTAGAPTTMFTPSPGVHVTILGGEGQ